MISEKLISQHNGCSVKVPGEQKPSVILSIPGHSTPTFDEPRDTVVSLSQKIESTAKSETGVIAMSLTIQ